MIIRYDASESDGSIQFYSKLFLGCDEVFLRTCFNNVIILKSEDCLAELLLMTSMQLINLQTI